MAHVTKYTPQRGDKLALIARREAAEELGLDGDDARALYPISLAAVVIQAFRNQELMIAAIEVQGFEDFRKYVRGEFAESNLEDFEIKEAFDIICREGRSPGQPLHFKFDTPKNQRTLTAVARDYYGSGKH